MNAPFDAIYKMAQDREDEIRRASYVEGRRSSAPVARRRFQGRVAGVLRSLADRLDPHSSYGQGFSRKATAE